MEASMLSVVVLTHSRPATLRRTLDSVRAQDLSGVEVIVVDNGSRDETASVLREEYPWVRAIRSEENLGIEGRNVGFRAAKGEFILSLDDDIELVDATTLGRITARMRERPELAALTLKICEEATGDEYVPQHWWHPPPRETHQDTRFDTDRINEAAVLFRAEALRSAGYYFADLFWGGEEWDLVLGLLDEGYRIEYEPIKVLHLAPRGSLNVKADERHVLLLRNRIWIAYRRLPFLAASLFAVPRLALWLVRSIRYGYFGYYAKGLWELLSLAPTIRRTRRPIRPETRAYLRSLRAGTPERLGAGAATG